METALYEMVLEEITWLSTPVQRNISKAEERRETSPTSRKVKQ
jgi:hypothetical protein